MSSHLTAHERQLCQRRCHHRYEFMHARKGSPKYVKNFGWARWWKHKIRVQMNRLYKDAHTKGKGGWKKDARGSRYQALGSAYTGKSCFTPLKVKGNKVSGGTPGERVVAAAKESARRSANGSRHSFYSQSGYWTVKYGITGEPYGARSDCSQWFTSIYWSAGLPDPNGNNYQGGWTGTLGARGRKITRAQARKTPGAAILYGPYPHHHVEFAVGDGSEKTIGHGSPPVDGGTFDLLSGPKTYRAYV